MFNEHFNYGESARALRSMITEVTTDLCNWEKQPISSIEETKQFIEVETRTVHILDLQVKCSRLVQSISIETIESRARWVSADASPHSPMHGFRWSSETLGWRSISSRCPTCLRKTIGHGSECLPTETAGMDWISTTLRHRTFLVPTRDGSLRGE